MNNFNLQETINFANYSKLAYGKTQISSDLKFEWIDGLKNLKPVDIQCLVIYETDKTIFSFRGTDDFRKWMIDASVKFKHLNNKIKVHTGFYNSVDSIYAELLKIAKNSKKIHTTGHSKGGGEARQFTYRLATENNILVKSSITFGEPRSFNRRGSNHYNSLNIPTTRFIDQEDIVCRIPWLLGTYKHVKDEIFIDQWQNLLLNEPFYAHIPSDLTGIIKELIRRKFAIIDDHAIDIYIKELNDILNRFTTL